MSTSASAADTLNSWLDANRSLLDVSRGISRDKVIDHVTQLLEDLGEVHFANIDLTDALQDGYDLVAILACALERHTYLDISATSPYYNFYSLISNYYRPIAIYNTQTKRWLEPTTFLQLREQSDRWERDRGNPREFAILGYNYIVLHPTPITAITDGLLVLYNAVPDTASGQTVVDLPEENINILEDYMVSDLLDQDLEYERSLVFFKRFQERLEMLRKKLEKRSWPDRMYTLVG